jgi:hypothetical protein
MDKRAGTAERRGIQMKRGGCNFGENGERKGATCQIGDAEWNEEGWVGKMSSKGNENSAPMAAYFMFGLGGFASKAKLTTIPFSGCEDDQWPKQASLITKSSVRLSRTTPYRTFPPSLNLAFSELFFLQMLCIFKTTECDDTCCKINACTRSVVSAVPPTD